MPQSTNPKNSVLVYRNFNSFHYPPDLPDAAIQTVLAHIRHPHENKTITIHCPLEESFQSALGVPPLP